MDLEELFSEAETRQPPAEVPDTVPAETVVTPSVAIDKLTDTKAWTTKGVFLVAGGAIMLLVAVWVIVVFVKKAGEHSHDGTDESDSGSNSGS